MPCVSAVIRTAAPCRFIVTYRTLDGGHHRFEHADRDADHTAVRTAVSRRIETVHARSHVVPGSIVIQQVRR